mmetsp:Transcript_20445/g.51461  ORF Transcript_20445/g.51461 Transcript_20445/m.51461 type:complete len:266 (-) Transcript_20445:191-988(-)
MVPQADGVVVAAGGHDVRLAGVEGGAVHKAGVLQHRRRHALDRRARVQGVQRGHVPHLGSVVGGGGDDEAVIGRPGDVVDHLVVARHGCHQRASDDVPHLHAPQRGPAHSDREQRAVVGKAQRGGAQRGAGQLVHQRVGDLAGVAGRPGQHGARDAGLVLADEAGAAGHGGLHVQAQPAQASLLEQVVPAQLVAAPATEHRGGSQPLGGRRDDHLGLLPLNDVHLDLQEGGVLVPALGDLLFPPLDVRLLGGVVDSRAKLRLWGA